MANNTVPGTGRGKKGQFVHQDPDRPDCPKCGNLMTSSGRDWRCKPCKKNIKKIRKDQGMEKYNKSLGFDPEPAEAHGIECGKGERLLITSAQNNTMVNSKIYKTIQHISSFYEAPIAVIPSHYVNKSLWQPGQPKEYDERIIPWIVKGDIQFNNVLIKSDVRINPTMVNPLGGKQNHGGNLWTVFGHPQLAREPIATLTGFPKLMHTTGSITEPSYTVSNEGEKGLFNHCMACLLLERYTDDFTFIRTLVFDDKGHCYDFDTRFTPSGVSHGHRVDALNPGDTHAKWNIMKESLYGPDGLVPVVRPHKIVHNDVVDSYAISHHHEKQPMIQYQKHLDGSNDMRAEMDQAIQFLNDTTPDYAECVIVPSNHHDHILKWLDKADANKDHTNARLILELQTAMREAMENGEDWEPFQLYAKDKLTCKHRFLSRNEPYYIGPKGEQVNHSQHGDIGPNGSRGSPAGFVKLPDRISAAHIHGAIRRQGYMSAGDSTGRMGYERGYSTHSRTVILQFKNGKRTHVDFIDGMHRLPHAYN